MDYGKAKFMLNKQLKNQLLLIPSERYSGVRHKFHKRNEKCYRCASCASCKTLGKNRIITVSDGRIVGTKHPEDGHHINCRPVTKESLEVLQIDREMLSVARVSGKRSIEAYTEAMSSISKRFKSSAKQNATVAQFPGYSEVRRQLNRHRAEAHIPVPNPFDIPEELRTTMRGKSIEEGDEHFQERFLLYSGQNGRVLVFAADTELQTLYNSEYIICDGTFEMAPNSSYQLYTIHGFIGKEGLALIWALLPNKIKTTYIELFTSISEAFLVRFGNVGQ